MSRLTRQDLVRELAAVSHSSWLRQKVRDHKADPSTLSPQVHPHDVERAEDIVDKLEELGVVAWADTPPEPS
jgi:hypothetical protein